MVHTITLDHPSIIVHITNQLNFNILGSYVKLLNNKTFLSLNETRLLYFFCTNPNRRILTCNIIAYMQNYSNSYFTEQNIYVYINRLRKKIEPCSTPEILINMRPGYMLNAQPYILDDDESELPLALL